MGIVRLFVIFFTIILATIFNTKLVCILFVFLILRMPFTVVTKLTFKE